MSAPSRTLSHVAMQVWVLQQMLGWGVATLVVLVVAINADWLSVLWILAPLVAGTAASVVIPRLRWARWRWDINDEGIDIQHGTLAVSRTLVPWIRVQHVDTRRGVFEQVFKLSTVVVHTAAGSHTIPLLPAPEADELRTRIAGLARTEEEEDVDERAVAEPEI